ncbi:hypothetical protein Q7L71_09625 [Conexibacter sp. CPCC 205706]|nr:MULTISPECIES: hypothetical protein [unclassified Conexibacter]MDO8185839.1 hypothetical protein [Conexibacter sp. CPCC 205706]MDO8198583.1 hypothetical protein [Conexibacter sp. CPCC 205762]
MDLGAHGVALAVERVAAGDDRDQAAGLRERQRLDDDVVVDRVPTVAGGVVERDVAERDVADDEVKRALRQSRSGERLAADRGLGVQGVGDLGACGVQLDARHLGVGRRHADEDAGAAARFEDAAGGEAEASDRVPDLADIRHVGEVRVDRCTTRREIIGVVEQSPQALALHRPVEPVFVEQERDCPPARPARQRLLLSQRRRAPLVLYATKRLDRGEVRVDAGASACWRELGLADGTEP